MAVYAWSIGAANLLMPASLTWGERIGIRSSGASPLAVEDQTIEIPYSHRWWVEMVLRRSTNFAERARQEAWLSQQRGGANRCTFWHFQHPVPYGTLRGALTLSGALAQGATTATIAGGTNGQTVFPGDMVGITTSAAYALQVVRVTVGGTVSAGTVPITFEPPLRASAALGAAVVVDRPAALFKMVESSWSQTSSAKNAEPIQVAFREVTTT